MLCLSRQYSIESPQNSGKTKAARDILPALELHADAWTPSWPAIESVVVNNAVMGMRRSPQYSGIWL